jgi:hypothetical protein
LYRQPVIAEIFEKKKRRGKTTTTILKSKSPEAQKQSVIQQWKDGLATVPDGQLPTNQKTEEEEEERNLFFKHTYLRLLVYTVCHGKSSGAQTGKEFSPAFKARQIFTLLTYL